MVAVKEFSWEEISGPDFGNPVGQAWQQVVAHGVGHMTVDTCGKPYLPTLLAWNEAWH